MQPAHDRLLLFCELNGRPSVPILRVSHKVMFEPPAGLEASLERRYLLSEERSAVKPREHSKVYFLVAWLHAVMVERLR